MFRNLFAVFATVLLGAGTASASTPATESGGLSLQQRIQAAQKTIGGLMDVTDPAAKAGSEKTVQYWSNYYRPWHNWRNWNNWRNYRGGYGY
ncbi:MAG: hypothetical protein HY056_11150 [Proteobacteria bacterium]|nr:hypothetical protein [Pseudomonadota bacterium]